MKTKWKFAFETTDFIFAEQHKFQGTVPRGSVSSSSHDADRPIEFNLSIEPDNQRRNGSVEQTGILYITIPFNYEEGKEIIKGLAYQIVQRISFDFGIMSLKSGMIICERLPETPEERKLVGEDIFAAEISLVEVAERMVFDPRKMTAQSRLSMDSRLVAQYNGAKESINPVDRFLGFFKIIETLFGPPKTPGFLKDVLLENKVFYDLFTKVSKFESVEQCDKDFRIFVSSIVEGRNKCAHMRLQKNFGYWASDPRIKEEIEPLIRKLGIVSYYAIRGFDLDQ